MVLIRVFEPDDAEPVVRLLETLMPTTVQTAASLRWRQSSEPPRARRRSWVAAEDGDVIGFATAVVQWYGGERGKGRIWLGVRADRRRRGIGRALWERAVEHLDGVEKLTVEVDDDPAGLAFVERRGFRQYDAEVISRLDPRECDLEERPHEGHRVITLRDARDRGPDLYEFYEAAGGIPPGDPENRVPLEEWRHFILGNPMLDDETSVIVLDGEERIVSLAWLLADRERGRAENEWTATLPQLRRLGLARVAKVASIDRAAEHGITEIVTGSDPDNLAMRELNRRLGYRELFVRRDFERVP
jgi:GNAT superfamily N-acetyltransferase